MKVMMHRAPGDKPFSKASAGSCAIRTRLKARSENQYPVGAAVELRATSVQASSFEVGLIQRGTCQNVPPCADIQGGQNAHSGHFLQVKLQSSQAL